MTSDIKPVMPIFVDCEFTDFMDPELISIGLVCGSRELYIELEGIDPDRCSGFVRSTVLPLLQGGECRLSIDNARATVHEWILGFGGDVIAVSDSNHDFAFLRALLAQHWPANLRKNCRTFDLNVIEPDEVHYAACKAFVAAMKGGQPHHALDDARALAAAWNAATALGWQP